jgi:hypothetical protein
MKTIAQIKTKRKNNSVMRTPSTILVAEGRERGGWIPETFLRLNP